MAYIATIDERYYGGFSQYAADALDASNNLNEVAVLAEGSTGYGFLTDAYFSADIDVYSLGILDSGYYSVDVDGYSWDFSEFGFGSVSSFQVLNSYGGIVDTSYSSFTDIDFTVESASTYYVKIEGPSFGTEQYSVEYTRTGDLESANSAALFSDAVITGNHTVGETLTANLTYLDANGVSSAIPYTFWYADGVSISSSLETNSYTLTASDAGKIISVAVGFYDDSGNYEDSGLFGANTVVAAANKPATFSNPTHSGSLVAGTSVTSSISYSDPDGKGDDTLYTLWYLDDGDLNNGLETYLSDHSSANGSITLDTAWVGQILYSAKIFKDSAGNIESSWDGSGTNGLYKVGTITAAAPTSTITSVAYNGTSGVLTLAGTNFDGIGAASASTDIKSLLNWSNLSWDINGDDGTTANASFNETRITSAYVTNASTLTVTLTSDGKTALEATTGFGTAGNADTIDVTAGFIKDIAGNPATTDGKANAAVTYSDTTSPTVSSFTSTTADGSYGVDKPVNITATISEAVIAGSAITVTLSTNDTVILTADAAGTTLLSGTYSVSTDDASADLSISSYELASGQSVTDIYGNQMTSTTIPANNNLADNNALVIDTAASTEFIDNVNNAPEVSSTAITSASLGSEYSYSFSGTDVDTGDILTFSAINLPDWLNFDVSTGILSGTPNESNLGEHSVKLRLLDDSGAVATETFNITVARTESEAVGQTAVSNTFSNYKTIAVIVDDFSPLSYTNDYSDNLHIYDYADYNMYDYNDLYSHDLLYDTWDDYGDVDATNYVTLLSEYTNVSNYFDETNHSSETVGPFYRYGGYNDYVDTLYTTSLGAHNPSTGYGARHGDFVLEAFTSSLDNPDDVEIILVDIDFTDADDIENLLNTTAVYAGEEVSELKHILYQAFDEFYEEDTFYTLVGFNASWGGTDISSALSVVEEFIGDDTYVVQAAPNVSQHGVNWGSAIPNVINVGAWNVDQDNYFLAGQTSQLDNIDIYANGYIEDDILGANFGTSFAAPRVFAELLNWHETNVVPMLKSGELVITKTDLTASEETFVTNYLIDTLSTDIELSLVGDSNYYGPLNLLTATIDNNTLAPVVVPYSVVGLESQLNTYSLVIYNSHDLAGTVVSRGGGILSDVTIAADMSNPDDQLTDISSNIGTFAMEVDNGASVSLLADMIHTNASPTKAITPQDALEALRLSVGLTTIGGSKTALDFMAADFNQNGKVTPQDALDILKYSVGLRELDTDWMFVDSAGDYSGITKGDVSFTEGVSIADMSADASVGLTGILLGDVNDTYTSYLDSSGTMV